MKLDRNINPDGRGKYALLNLRKNTIEWGDECQFFVIKYSDQFAVHALNAYADAVREEALRLESEATMDKGVTSFDANIEKAKDLHEYADQIRAEALAASITSHKLPD